MTKFTEWDYSVMTIEEIRDSYGMFTKEGSKAVAALVELTLMLPMTVTNEELYASLKTGMKEIKKQGHGEVYDTEVREQIIGTIEKRTKRELSIFEI